MPSQKVRSKIDHLSGSIHDMAMQLIPLQRCLSSGGIFESLAGDQRCQRRNGFDTFRAASGTQLYAQQTRLT
jgi:hypothetical protein